MAKRLEMFHKKMASELFSEQALHAEYERNSLYILEQIDNHIKYIYSVSKNVENVCIVFFNFS